MYTIFVLKKSIQYRWGPTTDLNICVCRLNSNQIDILESEQILLVKSWENVPGLPADYYIVDKRLKVRSNVFFLFKAMVTTNHSH